MRIRDSYTLNNNASTRFANWGAYKMTSTNQTSGRSYTWRQDTDLPASDNFCNLQVTVSQIEQKIGLNIYADRRSVIVDRFHFLIPDFMTGYSPVMPP
ncbi:hypothetical protein [Pectobacterium carotovorum]|uniref:hypothetical protein n=1 Tax=Pectobacterium carotovorum TaxID=554 RepID=UPI0037C75C37